MAVSSPARCWSFRSVAILVSAWLVLQFGGLFSPGLLDDVDSIYIEIAREMLQRHDYVTPYINGIRFFDKPPLMYWMAAASMRVFGVHDWAARLPLALSVLALLFAVYALGVRLFADVSPVGASDRGGFYAALAVVTSIGPYLYTRFYIPDILLALWMTLGVHLFLIALERVRARRLQPDQDAPSALLPCVGFGAVMALNVLTKGLIGLVFPVGFVFFYLVLTRQLRFLFRLHLLASAAVFLVIAAPWHILAALRNPAIALPTGLGLPVSGGWAWFYLYNEHVARFLSKRIPHDYGLTPVWLFLLYLAIWVMPWVAFLPGGVRDSVRGLRESGRAREAGLSLVLWTVLVVGFFCVSNRQEYYSLPAIPALALMAGGMLAQADRGARAAVRQSLLWSAYFLVPVATVLAVVCGYFAFAAPKPAAGTDIVSLLAIAGGPEMYNLSLSHIFDLTGAAMGFFRGPLAATALGMLGVGLGSYLLRRRGRTYAANLTLAASMTCVLLAAHEGLARFYPILGSKELALSIEKVRQTGDLILLDGELTSGSTLIFYTGQQIHLLNGRVNGLWYGSFWPDAPSIFESESSLHQLWTGSRRVFLLTYNPGARTKDLARYGEVRTVSSAGGKTVLTNH